MHRENKNTPSFRLQFCLLILAFILLAVLPPQAQFLTSKNAIHQLLLGDLHQQDQVSVKVPEKDNIPLDLIWFSSAEDGYFFFDGSVVWITPVIPATPSPTPVQAETLEPVSKLLQSNNETSYM